MIKIIISKKHLLLLIMLNVKMISAQITTYSGSFGFLGVADENKMEPDEVSFSLETTLNHKENIAQLYRWRLLIGNFKGLVFEYNSRIYFGEDRDYKNTKWFLQGKVGYGILKGRTYEKGTLSFYDANGNFISNNLESYECPWNFSVNYGLNVGYKFLLSEVFIIDCSLGYQGSTLPDFENNQALTQRKADWDNGIAFPVNFQWSLGFFIE